MSSLVVNQSIAANANGSNSVNGSFADVGSADLLVNAAVRGRRPGPQHLRRRVERLAPLDRRRANPVQRPYGPRRGHERRGRPGRAFGQVWPIARPQIDSVVVQFVCGYGNAAAVPANVQLALKMLVAHFYGNRAAVSLGAFTEVPMAVRALLAASEHGAYA